MGTLSVSVPDELKEKMTRMEEVNWSAVARKAFEEKIKDIEFMHSIAKKSKLSDKDADEISTKISKSMAKKFREM
ncbi:MAG TPA: hypothetical protein VI968_01405 [archaeon]|nr:hypothetical protein [archaeon]